MTWFDELTGFPETSPDEVRAQLRREGTRLTSLVNNRTYQAGTFTTPTLAELRTGTVPGIGRNLTVDEVVGDVRELHLEPSNENAVFQVASQFNCLEMITPQVTPEDGVGIYEDDQTQGPTCSVCAGAGTIDRNYFAKVNGRIGQSRDNQIDCLADIGKYFGNDERKLWVMQNGYCFPTPAGLHAIEKHLAACEEQKLEEIRGKLRVGIQSQTQVTIEQSTHLVTQVFCSGLPLDYSDIPNSEWNHFPRLVLDACYEATFHAAVRNLEETGCGKLYLTLVGGGVFGNKLDWILTAIGRSLQRFEWANLDVHIVSYWSSKPEVARLVEFFNSVKN